MVNAVESRWGLERDEISFRPTSAEADSSSPATSMRKENKRLAQLDLDELKKYSSSIEEDVYQFIGALNVAGKYVTEGAAGPCQMKEQIGYWTNKLGQR